MLLVENLSCRVTKQLAIKNRPLFEGINANSIRHTNSAFYKIHRRHFSGVVSRFKKTYVEFIQDSTEPKLFKLVYGLFLTELFKNENVAIFWDTL